MKWLSLSAAVVILGMPSGADAGLFDLLAQPSEPIPMSEADAAPQVVSDYHQGGCCERIPSRCDHIWDGYCQSRGKGCHKSCRSGKCGPTQKNCGPTQKRCAPAQKQCGPTQKRYAPAQKHYAPVQKRCAPVQKRCAPTQKYCGPTQKTCGPTQKHFGRVQKHYGVSRGCCPPFSGGCNSCGSKRSSWSPRYRGCCGMFDDQTQWTDGKVIDQTPTPAEIPPAPQAEDAIPAVPQAEEILPPIPASDREAFWRPTPPPFRVRPAIYRN